MAVSNYYRTDGWVKTTLGPAVAGAQVYICTQPADSAFVPPTPLARIYSDDGITPIIQPILTDGFGHYDYYVLPGLYTEVIVFNGAVQQVYPDQSVGNVGTGSGTAIVFETNGTPNFNQVLQNLVQGAGILIVTDNFGNTTLTAPRTASIQYVIDGGGSVVSTGLKGQISMPLGATITGWVLSADQAGSAVVDVLRSTYAGFPTTTSIAGTDKPTLSSAQINRNLAVTVWTTTLNAGDEVQFNVVSASTVTRLNLTINLTMQG